MGATADSLMAPATAGDAEWRSGTSRARLAPVLTGGSAWRSDPPTHRQLGDPGKNGVSRAPRLQPWASSIAAWDRGPQRKELAVAGLDDDLYGSAPDSHPLALLLVDVINPLDFPEGDEFLRHALPAPEKVAA